jgi:hypothetical protein
VLRTGQGYKRQPIATLEKAHIEDA